MTNNNERGQTLILMLIVTVISLTIGVSISSRAISTLKQTSYTAQAGKAQKFSDAGIEHVLGVADIAVEAANCPSTRVPLCSLDVDGGGDDVQYYVDQSGNGPTVEATLTKDQTIEIDLTGYAAGQNIDIFWVKIGSGEDASAGTEAALVVSLIYEDGGVAKLQRYAIDKNHAARANENNFTEPSVGNFEIPAGSGNHYKYQYSNPPAPAVPIQAPAGTTPKALRIRALYNTTSNSFVAQRTGTNTFSNQGYKITSKGIYGEAEWTAEVTKMNPALPAIFDYAIFSEGDLTK